MAESVGDFAYSSLRFDGGEDGGDEIFGGGGAAGKLSQGGFDARRVAVGSQGLQTLDLGALDLRINAERTDRPLFFRNEFVHADYNLFAALDCALVFVSGFLYFSLDETGFD